MSEGKGSMVGRVDMVACPLYQTSQHLAREKFLKIVIRVLTSQRKDYIGKI